jgi:hypothetical protein
VLAVTIEGVQTLPAAERAAYRSALAKLTGEDLGDSLVGWQRAYGVETRPCAACRRTATKR